LQEKWKKKIKMKACLLMVLFNNTNRNTEISSNYMKKKEDLLIHWIFKDLFHSPLLVKIFSNTKLLGSQVEIQKLKIKAAFLEIKIIFKIFLMVLKIIIIQKIMTCLILIESEKFLMNGSHNMLISLHKIITWVLFNKSKRRIS
jgi:hypothetical protein